jgi:hypothetical protein
MFILGAVEANVVRILLSLIFIIIYRLLSSFMKFMGL